MSLLDAADMRPLVAVAPTPTDLHSFRLAHPLVRSSSQFEITTIAVLSLAALTVWLVVLPLEIVLRLTV